MRSARSSLAIVERQFPQARARQTWLALLDAARELFAERGFDGAQTPDIAARAGVSTGSFYRYFADKRAIFVEMIRRHLAEIHDDVIARLEPARFERLGDHRALIDEALAALFDHVGRYPGLERVCLEMALRDPEVGELRRVFEERAQAALAALIAEVVPREVVPDARAAACVVHHAALGVALAEAHGIHPGGKRRISVRAARTELREMFHRYLFPHAPAAHPSRERRG